MADIKNLRLNQLHGRLGELVYQFTRVQFTQGGSPAWSPPVNAYKCEHGFAICADLAGVDRDRISIEVQARSIKLYGTRETPEPRPDQDKTSQIITMEMDCGPFAREITFPDEIETDAVRAEYRNGLLWVYLPFKGHG